MSRRFFVARPAFADSPDSKHDTRDSSNGEAAKEVFLAVLRGPSGERLSSRLNMKRISRGQGTQCDAYGWNYKGKADR